MKQKNIYQFLGAAMFAGLCLAPHQLYAQATDDSTVTMTSRTSWQSVGLQGEGTETSPFLIHTVDNLKLFRDNVNEGLETIGVYFSLGGDIQLDEAGWNPIGNFDSPFTGIFNGAGYSISGMSSHQQERSESAQEDWELQIAEHEVAGLFGVVRGGTIQNLTVEGASISRQESDSALPFYGGILASHLENVTVKNVKVQGNIDINKEDELEVSDYNRIGALAGQISGGNYQSIQIDATITGAGEVGGLAGKSNLYKMETFKDITADVSIKAINGGRYGGLIGHGGEVEISGSWVKADFVSEGELTPRDGEESFGGFIGHLNYVFNLTNSKADIKVEAPSMAMRIGGVAGYIGNGSPKLTDSYAVGMIDLSQANENSSAGGFLGQSWFNTFTNSYSAVKFQNNNQNVDTGGLIGRGQLNTFEEMPQSYWDNTQAQSAIGDNPGFAYEGFNGLSLAEMTAEAALLNMPSLDFETTWKTTCALPALSWELDSCSGDTDNAGNTTINGNISGTVISFTVPTELSFLVNPNASEGERFVAPEFTVSNDSNSPLTLSVGTFEETTEFFTDVHGDRYQDSEWDKLGVKDSKQFALALNLEEGENWLIQTQLESLYAKSVQDVESDVELGTIRPNSDVNFNFSAKHGLAFKEALSPEYSITFIFDLFNE